MQRMRLSEPVQIPEPFRQIVIDFLRQYMEDVTWELRNHFGIELDVSEIPHNDDELLCLMVAEPISEMARAAAGDTTGLDQATVYEGIQELVERLFGIPGEASYSIPREFWESEFGSMVMMAYVWSQGDELLTMSQAAEMSGKSVASISNMAKRGRLQQYPDMREPNPQKRMRVLKSEIEALAKPQ